jgi:hypothetical protein
MKLFSISPSSADLHPGESVDITLTNIDPYHDAFEFGISRLGVKESADVARSDGDASFGPGWVAFWDAIITLLQGYAPWPVGTPPSFISGYYGGEDLGISPLVKTVTVPADCAPGTYYLFVVEVPPGGGWNLPGGVIWCQPVVPLLAPPDTITDPDEADFLVFTLTVSPLPVPPSTITAVPDSIEAGPARSTITVTAMAGGLPVVGAAVALSATGTDNTITQPTGPTDANGQAVGYLSSTKAEVKTVSATVGGNDLGVTVGVTVTPGPPDPTFSYLDPSSLHTNVLAGGTGIGIWIRDQYGNGVAGETPGVAVGGGTVTDPVPTGGDGGTTTTYTPPTDSGPQTLTVTLGAVHLELPIEVDAGPLDHFGIAVPAEVMLGGQTVASCAAEDLYGNVVTGFTGQLDLTATGSRLLATPIRTAAFDAGVGFPALVFLDLATGVRVHGAEVRGAHSGVSNLFAVIEPWAPPAHPPGGSFTSGAGASGVWQPVPDREWEDRDG